MNTRFRFATILSTALAFSNFAFAGDDHGHDHGHDHEGHGLIIENDACVGLLGRAGAAGAFELGSEEIELSGEVAQCNLCLSLGETADTCLVDETREPILNSVLAGGLADGLILKPGLREGAKATFSLNDGTKETYVCHFHSYESGEIDCH